MGAGGVYFFIPFLGGRLGCYLGLFRCFKGFSGCFCVVFATVQLLNCLNGGVRGSLSTLTRQLQVSVIDAIDAI